MYPTDRGWWVLNTAATPGPLRSIHPSVVPPSSAPYPYPLSLRLLLLLVSSRPIALPTPTPNHTSTLPPTQTQGTQYLPYLPRQAHPHAPRPNVPRSFTLVVHSRSLPRILHTGALTYHVNTHARTSVGREGVDPECGASTDRA